MPIQQTVIRDVIERKRREEDVPVEAPIAVGRRGRGPMFAAGFDVRQAVVMREILDKPIGLRSPVDDQF